MPTTPGGIDYKVLFAVAGGKTAYSETFARDGNAFTAYLEVDWAQVQDFRREILGYSEYDPSTIYSLKRTVGIICPYTNDAYPHTMTLMNYFRDPNGDSATTFDATVEIYNSINSVTVNGEKPALYDDPAISLWWQSHKAVYKVDYIRQPFIIVDDAKLAAFSSGTYGCELDRYVTRQRANNVRELRTGEYNFQIAGTTTPVLVNGFTPSVEAEIIYTWFQVPFANIPRTTIDANRLKINSATFDNGIIYYPVGGSGTRPGFEAETMLFVDAKGIDLPYQGPDGGYYADIVYIFRLKRNYASDGTTVVGHQHFLDATGNWVKVERRSPAPAGTYLYKTTPDFGKLFTPQA